MQESQSLTPHLPDQVPLLPHAAEQVPGQGRARSPVHWRRGGWRALLVLQALTRGGVTVVVGPGRPGLGTRLCAACSPHTHLLAWACSPGRGRGTKAKGFVPQDSSQWPRPVIQPSSKPKGREGLQVTESGHPLWEPCLARTPSLPTCPLLPGLPGAAPSTSTWAPTLVPGDHASGAGHGAYLDQCPPAGKCHFHATGLKSGFQDLRQ